MSRRLSSLLLSIGLVLSCTKDVAGPPSNANRAPTAKIVTVPADSIQEGSPITFDASASSDPEGDSLTYAWDLGDGLSATGPVAKRSYHQLGSHAVTLIVADQQGESDTATTSVLAVNAMPVITRIEGPGGPIGVGNPTTVLVTARDPGSGDVLTMRIDWKDGTTFTGGYHQDQPYISISHTYSAMGTYAVEVTVEDNDGGVTKGTIDKPIVVVANTDPGGNRTPTAKITKGIPPGPLPEGTVIAYDATSSSDPDGDSLSYLWNWGVGSARTAWSNVAAYYDEDSYEVILIVTDQHGASDTAEVDETVVNVPPTILYVVTPAGAILVGTSSEIRFRVQDPGVKDSLTAEVDWKDGTVSTATLTPHSVLPAFNASASHTYATPGTYAVEITARDNDGGVTKLTVDHPISAVGPHANHPPVAHITGPASGSEGAWIYFSGASSTDPDGDSLKVRCHAKDGKNPPSYPGYPDQSCTLAFPDNGTYLVSAVATDDSGAVDTATTTVTVTNVAPKLEWQFIPAHAAVGFRASIQVLVNDPGSADQNTITVDWGDGTGPTSVVAESSLYVAQDFDGDHELGGTLFHAYQNMGSYTITVTDQDDDGGASNSITSSPVIVFNANQRQTVAGYEAMDLGTLGGTSARPADLNDHGQIVGTSMTDRWALHGFLWDQGYMRDLGTTGEHASEAVRINESGMIAGTVWNRLHGTLDDNCISTARGAVWQNGVPTSLTGQGFCHNTYDGYGWLSGQWQPRLVRAMNGSGDIAMIGYGKFDISSGLWRNGWQQMQLPSPWYPMYPTAMNDHGQVVGTAHQGEGSPHFHAFIWENGAGRDLGVLFGPRPCTLTGYGPQPDCSKAAAQDINESGQIVGISSDTVGQFHFVSWTDVKIEDLGLAEWPRTADGPGPRIVINDHGDIAASVGGKAFFLRGGVKTEIPATAGALDVVQLNENGEVVGNILMGGLQHIFVWSASRGMTDLGSGPDGFDAAWVVDINARGDILGYTAPCKLTYYSPTHCYDFAVDYWAMQVRTILWRNTQASASR